ncbi:hypothetical protein N431DRAFT_9885 [Stipitochalara longipes BDJ]|nr:hypothetical protein N431DRAFT_9885 [Stipitochalara longipes BDJ]
MLSNDDIVTHFRARFSAPVSSCHVEAARIKRNWDSSSASSTSSSPDNRRFCVQQWHSREVSDRFPNPHPSRRVCSMETVLESTTCFCLYLCLLFLRRAAILMIQFRRAEQIPRSTREPCEKLSPPCGVPLRVPCALISPDSS